MGKKSGKEQEHDPQTLFTQGQKLSQDQHLPWTRAASLHRDSFCGCPMALSYLSSFWPASIIQGRLVLTRAKGDCKPHLGGLSPFCAPAFCVVGISLKKYIGSRPGCEYPSFYNDKRSLLS
jgi:hypothetical protein